MQSENSLKHILMDALSLSISLSLSVRIMPDVVRFYRREETREGRVLRRIAQLHPDVTITTELCYNVELDGERMSCKFAIVYTNTIQIVVL